MGNNKRDIGAQPRKEAKGRNEWDEQQRLVLHLLHVKFPGLDPKTRYAVFNVCFKQHLARRGLSDGLLGRAICSQYSERRHKSLIWGRIIAEPKTESEVRRRQCLTRRIKQRADAVTSQSVTDFADITDGDGNENVEIGSATLEVPRTPTRRRNAMEQTSAMDQDTPETPAKWSGLRQAPAWGRFTASVTVSNKGSPKKRQAEVQNVIDESDLEEALPLPEPGHKKLSSPSNRRNKSSRLTMRSKPERTIEQYRLSGPPLKATPAEFREMALPPVPVADTLAHPPSSGLLYRYWDEHSQGINSETGFVAGLYDQCNSGIYNASWKKPAPESTELDWLLVENHINRREKDSPFISTSNCLVWILRLAAKRRSLGAKYGEVTLMSTENMNSVYHVTPYWRQLLRQRPFTDAAWYYGGLHEFLVWHEIKPEHIVCTFEVSRLFELVEQLPTLAAILRLDFFHEAQDYKKMLSRLRSLQNELNEQSVMAIARFCRFIGLAGASTRCLQHVLADIIQGWRLKVPRHTDEQWLDLSVYWVRGLLSRSVAGFQRQQQLHMCFLFAVKEGMGDFNMLHTPDRVRKMQKRSTAVGLESPVRICEGALQEGLVTVREYENTIQERYAHALEALLPGIEEIANSELPVVGESQALTGDSDEISSEIEEIGDEIMFNAEDEDDDCLGL